MLVGPLKKVGFRTQMVKNSLLVLVTCLLLLAGMGYGQSSEEKPQKSMMYSCQTATFLSVSVSTPKRNDLPHVQIRLADPLFRQQGVSLSGRRIPKSRYEDVVVAPRSPDRSREHAVEVCGAEQGQYALTIYEHGDELYRVEIGVNVNAFLSVTLHSQEGRVRHYRFSFTVINEDHVNLTWLDEKGKPELVLEP